MTHLYDYSKIIAIVPCDTSDDEGMYRWARRNLTKFLLTSGNQENGQGYGHASEIFKLVSAEVPASYQQRQRYAGFPPVPPPIVRTVKWRNIGTRTFPVYTILPQALLDKFGEAISVGDTLGNSFTSDDQWRPQSSWTNVWRNTHRETIAVDTLADFSFLGGTSFDDRAEAFQVALGSKKINVLRLKQLFRGCGEQNYTFEEQSAKQIMRGSRVFLMRRNVKIFDSARGAFVKVPYVGLAIVNDFNKVLKYVKSREFFQDFIFNQIKNGSIEKLLDPVAYAEKRKKLAGATATYWNKIPELLPTEEISSYVASEWDSTEVQLKNKLHITNKEFHVLGIGSQIQKSPESQAVKKAAKAIERQKAVVQKYLDNLSNYQYLKNSAERRVTVLAEEIKAHENALKQQKAAIAQNARRIADTLPLKETSTEVLTRVEKQIAEAKLALAEKTKSILEAQATSGTDWFENFKQQGILVQDMIFGYKNQPNATVSLKTDPTVFADPDSWLKEITWKTLDPIVITGIKETKKVGEVVAGPYEFKARWETPTSRSTPYVQIRLATMKAIFGIRTGTNDNLTIKLHPHTDMLTVQKTAVNLKQSMSSWQTICPGELAAPLFSAFKDKRPKFIIQAVMAWAQTAYVNDSWGRHWTWFPKVGEVNLRKPEPEPEVVPETATTTEDTNIALHKRFTFTSDRSNKWWQIKVEGSMITKSWGRIGQLGRMDRSTYADEDCALKEAWIQIRRKLNGGYTEATIFTEGAVVEDAPQPTIIDAVREALQATTPNQGIQ